MGTAQPGLPPGTSVALAADASPQRTATSHISVVDGTGNAVSMTTTIEDVFGARVMVRGFLLNNQLTDFSFAPDANGKPIANRVQPGKRPRSSMAPTLVFDRAGGELVATLGSPGGSQIIGYVAKTLVGTLDWSLDIQQAIALPNADPSSVCGQCHTPGGKKASDSSIDWKPMTWPTLLRSRAGQIPPPIPHDSPMRTNCVTCHSGPSSVAEIRTTHPERSNCRQCHVQANAFAEDAFPLTRAPLGRAGGAR
jgi:hypothetical protein